MPPDADTGTMERQERTPAPQPNRSRRGPLRVAYVSMQFPRPSETFAGTDVRALREEGVQVEVFALRPAHHDHDALLRQRDLTDVPTLSLTPGGYLGGCLKLFTRPRWWAALLWWIVRWQAHRPKVLVRCLALAPMAVTIFERINAGRFDVVHLFWGHYPALVGHLTQRFAPHLVSSVFLGAYDIQEDQYGSFVPGSVPVAKRADTVWTHSRSNLERFRALGIPEGQVRCVYRGVDLRRYPFLPETGAAEREYARVVSIGSLIERKAMDHVLRVIAAVRERLPEVRLQILGDGPERASLEALARSLDVDDVVTFAGHVPAEAIAEALQRASAFVLLSKSDRIPNVVKEAMASGCPCVVSNTQGMDELVMHGRTGYLVDIGDLEAPVEHLSAVLLSPGGHAEMVAAARRHVERHFSAQASMLEYRQAWLAALEARAS